MYNQNSQTLAQLEEVVSQSEMPTPEQPAEQVPSMQNAIEDAQGAVEDAQIANAENAPPEPIAALNAEPLNLDLDHPESSQVTDSQSVASNPADNTFSVDPSTGQQQFPANLVPPSMDLPSETTSSPVDSPVAPPPVPPPMMPPAMPPVDSIMSNPNPQ